MGNMGNVDVLRMRRVVCWHRVAGSLPDHTISTSIRLWHRLLIAWICQVRRPNLRTAMMRPRRGKGGLGRLHWCHAVSARYKRLRLGVEGVVSVVAARDGMLTLRIMRINVRRELTECIWNSHMSLGTNGRARRTRGAWGASYRANGRADRRSNRRSD